VTAVAAATDRLTAAQLDLLRRMSELDDPPHVFGGYAEDALLAGTVTRPHGDIDWMARRSDLRMRLAQARALGFHDFETWGEAAPGQPFYIFVANGELKLEIGVTDEDAGHNVVRVHRLAFDIGGRPAPSGYQLVLPADTFDHPPAVLDGIAVRAVSPLALYQFRVGIAAQGSFGPLSERHMRTSLRVREKLLPDRSDAELAPTIEPITTDAGSTRVSEGQPRPKR
jgi:hypothetical protein